MITKKVILTVGLLTGIFSVSSSESFQFDDDLDGLAFYAPHMVMDEKEYFESLSPDEFFDGIRENIDDYDFFEDGYEQAELQMYGFLLKVVELYDSAKQAEDELDKKGITQLLQGQYDIFVTALANEVLNHGELLPRRHKKEIEILIQCIERHFANLGIHLKKTKDAALTFTADVKAIIGGATVQSVGSFKGKINGESIKIKHDNDIATTLKVKLKNKEAQKKVNELAELNKKVQWLLKQLTITTPVFISPEITRTMAKEYVADMQTFVDELDVLVDTEIGKMAVKEYREVIAYFNTQLA